MTARPSLNGKRSPSEAVRRIFPVSGIALLLGVYLLYDAISYTRPGPATTLAYAHSALMLAVAAVNLRWGVYFFVISVVSADEISRYLWEFTGDTGVTSFLTVSVGGVALSNLVALGLIAIAAVLSIVRFAQHPRGRRLLPADWALLTIGLVYLIASLHGVRNLFNEPRLAINHLNLPLMLLGLYFVVRFAFREPLQVFHFWRVALLAMAVKVIGWTILAFTGEGSLFGTTLRVGFGAGWNLFVFVLLLGVIFVIHGDAFRLLDRFIAAVLAILAGGLLLVNAGRMLWVFSALGLVLLLIFDKARAKLYALGFSALCGIAIVFLVTLLGEAMFGTIATMANTLKVWERHEVEASHSTMVRMYEFRNIHAQLVDHNNLLLGDGPGSTFSDRYHPFPFGLDQGDYSFEEEEQRRFNNSHSLVTQLMLQVGYLGMTVYLGAFAILSLMLWAACRRLKHVQFRLLALGILCFLPCLVYMSWNSKANMLLGLFIGGAGSLMALQHREDSKAAAIFDSAEEEAAFLPNREQAGDSAAPDRMPCLNPHEKST